MVYSTYMYWCRLSLQTSELIPRHQCLFKVGVPHLASVLEMGSNKSDVQLFAGGSVGSMESPVTSQPVFSQSFLVCGELPFYFNQISKRCTYVYAQLWHGAFCASDARNLVQSFRAGGPLALVPAPSHSSLRLTPTCLKHNIFTI